MRLCWRYHCCPKTTFVAETVGFIGAGCFAGARIFAGAGNFNGNFNFDNGINKLIKTGVNPNSIMDTRVGTRISIFLSLAGSDSFKPVLFW